MTRAVLASMAVVLLATGLALPESGGKMKPLLERHGNIGAIGCVHLAPDHAGPTWPRCP
jgi:hypothetical protein